MKDCIYIKEIIYDDKILYGDSIHSISPSAHGIAWHPMSWQDIWIIELN